MSTLRKSQNYRQNVGKVKYLIREKGFTKEDAIEKVRNERGFLEW